MEEVSPYIVTTKRRGMDPYLHSPQVLSRLAVATLDEAFNAVPEPHRSAFGLLDAILALPASGGTVGPLPDGMVIEVEATTWEWLILGGWGAVAEESALMQGYVTAALRESKSAQQRILDAYNARQT